MSNDLAQLPLWVRGIAETMSPAKRRQVARKIGIELRKANQSRTAAQSDADGNAFVAPLQAKNNPMFREITNARHFQSSRLIAKWQSALVATQGASPVFTKKGNYQKFAQAVVNTRIQSVPY